MITSTQVDIMRVQLPGAGPSTHLPLLPQALQSFAISPELSVRKPLLAGGRRQGLTARSKSGSQTASSEATGRERGAHSNSRR